MGIVTSETVDKPMDLGKFSMQEFLGGIPWNDKRLTKLRKVIGQTYLHPFSRDIRGTKIVGV